MIKRYKGGPHWEAEDGEYVEYGDYEKVLSQRDRLVALIQIMMPVKFNAETGKMELVEEEKKNG